MAAPTLQHSKTGSAAGAPTDDGLHLTVMGPQLFETYPLPVPGQVDIGREDGVHVRLVEGQASRMHARLRIQPSGKITVEDLGSRNGTFVSGERIPPGKQVVVQPGEAITIGFTHLMVQRQRPPLPTRRLRSHAAFEERLDDACEHAARGAGGGPAVIRARIAGEEPAGRGVDLIHGVLQSGDLLAQYAEGDYEILLLDTDIDRARSAGAAIERRLRAAGLLPQMACVAYPTHGRSAEALIGAASALLLDLESETESAPVLKSEAMRELYRLAERAAAGHSAAGLITVLVLGETGTGKEVLANWIHRRSPRANGPFMAINCAALTETLLESELFGHEKGAFTGATAAKPGLLEISAGGTVFLDEIGEMNAALQTKLLRTIDSREIMRVGGRASRPIDVRFIAATNRNLEAEVANGGFRRDLYFRLNGISLTIPPLRERPTDITPLARRFLAQASRAAKRRPPRLPAEAIELLQGHDWPGNIRELRNVMDRALVMCEGSEIRAPHLPVDKLRLLRMLPARAARDGAAPPWAPSGDDDRDRRRIAEAMAEFGGNQTRVAATLGMARGTLIARLERYGIRRPQTIRRRAT
jgi:two-component system, NtrC family, response regulator AtoC